MNGLLLSLTAFIVAIGVLVTVHEFGHFWVARRLGVKVLRFSIGFGKPLWKRTFGKDKTELVIAALPLGGYVKMLDEREGEVAAAELTRAFNRQPVTTRIAVVVAGPAFNFLFAIIVYWAMFVVGVPGLKPLVGEVAPASYAAEAGILNGDEILAIAGKPTVTWEATVLALLEASLDGRDTVAVAVRDADGQERHLQVHFKIPGELLKKGGVLENFGLRPWQPPAVIESLVAGSAGERAGLLPGDQVVLADGMAISNWGQWVDFVRERPGQDIAVQVLRDGEAVKLTVRPDSITEKGREIGRIGAYVQLPDDEQRATMRVVVRHGLLKAIPEALNKTWEMTTLTLRTLWKMVTGGASLENLSGPITIAQYAGQSAAIGLAAFLGFLGIVSVSLGVLNLLPVPVLDGGHLLFYLVELVTGSPVTDAVQLAGQKVGIVLLLALMSLAFYNDFIRLLD
ncbi:MAG: RIP metalloprotease RseP [Gammaproteobacteria bacterium]|nr:RIP metalloprotease RseP [Gammaproteobacteria bacterium]